MTTSRLQIALFVSIALVIGILIGHYINLPFALIQQHKTLRQAEKQVADNPSDPNNWLVLGTARFNLNDLDSARAAYTKALELDSNSLAACQSIGMIYLFKSDYPHAREWFTRSRSLAPAYGDAAVRQTEEFLQQSINGCQNEGKTN
jgi:Flp pilus assembly protein TadD